MRLALLTRSWTRVGGAERYAVDLATALAGAGHSVTVVAERVDEQAPRPAGVELLRLALGSRPPELPVTLGLCRTPWHHVYRAGMGSHAAWLEARGSAVPWRTRRALEEDWLAVRVARRVIANSERCADDLVRTHAGVSRRLRLVRTGVDLERFRPDPALRAAARGAWKAEGKVAFFLGRGFARKGLDVAVAAFERIAGPSDRFVVAGEDARALVTRFRLRARLGDRLVWMGRCPDPERWLPGADALILPTRYDPAANVTLEAMAVGVPPVTTIRDGSSEIVPERAWVVQDPRDVDALGKALGAAWDAGVSLDLRKVVESWPVSRNAGETLDVLREVADE